VSKWDAATGQHDYSRGPGGILHDSNGTTIFTPGLAQRSSTSDRFFHGDWLGSTRWMSEATNGNSFLVYGLFDRFGILPGADVPVALAALGEALREALGCAAIPCVHLLR
jgi:hypothetical protein